MGNPLIQDPFQAICLSGWRRKETVLRFLRSRMMKIPEYVFPGLMLYARIVKVGTLEV
jgi:hypothetical protein